MSIFNQAASRINPIKENWSILYALIMTLIALIIVSSSNGQSRPAPVNNTRTNTNQAKPVAGQKFIEGKDYTILERVRILDKTGFEKPVESFSLLIPKDWKSNGEVIWIMPGKKNPDTKTRFKSVSPEGKYSIELFPAEELIYCSEQYVNEYYRANNISEFVKLGQPLDAAPYFKQYFLNELGRPDIIDIQPNEVNLDALKEKMEDEREEIIREFGALEVNFYPSSIRAKVKWQDGSEGIVICGVIVSESIVRNKYDGTIMKAFKTRTIQKTVYKYPSNEYDKASKMMSTIISSYRTNMAWQNSIDKHWQEYRRQRNIVTREKIRLNDELTAQIGRNIIARGNENLKNMDTRTRNWEQSQASQDRIHSDFIKSIKGVETYRDETGVVELNSGYSHAWSRSDGSNFILSDDPNFDPSSVFRDQKWKEMKVKK